jgi:hypothetical protein
MQEMRPISKAELLATDVELVPDRETLALVNLANLVSVNIALAVNAATINSQANAWAGQLVAVGQF